MEPGRVIADRFVVLARVAQGGMGTVFRALDRRTESEVALKMLDDASVETVRRFENEGLVLAEIKHPGVVGFVGQGMHDGKLWLAMEWVEGETLADRLARRGEMPIADAITLGLQIARALAGPHSRGLVHRDIKPTNLLLPGGEVERVKLADFGIVHLGARSGNTLTGTVLGTPGYMAPEQARGAKGLDPRADVFSLGCVLFECLTGRPAFAGDHMLAILAKILLEDAPRVTELRPEVPPALAELLATMLAKDLLRRPLDGDAVANALETVAHATPTGPRLARARSPAITAGEQRIVSVVLAGDPYGGSAQARTLSGVDEERMTQIRAQSLPPDSRLEVLADGTVLVVMVGRTSARDQAAQAVHAALAMAAIVPDPVVVATGRGVLAGRWPVGEVIDRAADMLRTTPRGASSTAPVRLDELTAGLLDSRYEVRVEDGGFFLEREHRRDDTARRVCGVPTPCVGRDRELRMLEDIYREVCEERAPRAALVIAPGGVGKSRLRQELIARLALLEPFELLIGRGDPMRAGSPFGVLAHALRWTIGLPENRPLPAQRKRIAAHLAQWFSGEHARRLAVYLGELIGVPADEDDAVSLQAARRDPMLMGDLRREAWLDYLRAVGTDRPTVIVLEDLQWGDAGTVGLIDVALRDLDRPLFVLALARPELREHFPRLWSGRMLSEIALGELSKKSAEKLVRAVLRDAPADVVSRVVDRAAGNAFYLEELIRAVAAGEDELPETVLATVQTRLEALSPDTRRALRAGSVFGDVFSRAGITALAGHTTDAALADMIERELVYRRASSRGPDDPEYAFRNATVREAAYAMLTAEDRVLGHQLAGDWLETHGDTDPTMLAEHFERGNLPERAVDAYRRATEQALAGNDFAAAIAHAERGIALGATSNVRAKLRLAQAEAHRWRGELAEAGARAADAQGGLDEGCADWYHAIDAIIAASGRRADYGDVLERARLAASAQPVDAEARSACVSCLCEAGRMFCQIGRYDLSDEITSRIEHDMSDASLARVARVQVHRLRAARARHLGDLAGDLRGYQAVLDAFVEIGDARNTCNARVSVGFAYIELGDFDAAEQELVHALGDAERMYLETVATRARQNLALVLAHRGEHAKAIALLDRVIADSSAQNNHRFEGWTRIYLSIVARDAGDFARAESEAQLAASMFAGTPPARAGALAALARAQLRLGKPALSTARDAMTILDVFDGIEEFESLVWLALLEVLVEEHSPEAPVFAERAQARLHERAARLVDPEMRARFLAIPTNRAILQALR